MTMSKLDTTPYKGVRDFYPEDQFIENYIFDIWRHTMHNFGYEEYSASILEPADLYRAKSGDEIVNEQTYTFKDRGDREVTLRPEMTPTVARMVAHKRRELGLPLRWYSIPNLFRYEAPQRGRLREHWQLNADIFGVDSILADIEMIKLAHSVMRNFGAEPEDFEIRISDRGLVENHLLKEGVDPSKLNDARRLIDKKNKIDNFEEEMTKLVGKEIDLNIFPTEDINFILSSLQEAGITNAEFDPTLVRGFDYYTGTVFEIFDTNEENPRSILGGGRYDNLVSIFSDEMVPAVGFGAGDVTMRDFLETHNLLPEYRSITDIYIVLTDLDLAPEADQLAAKLREGGLNIAVDYTGRKIGDQIKSADKHKIPFVIVFGENEATTGVLSIKELSTGRETSATLEEIVEIING
jgi:histidyl-tRNA synthetase